MKKPSLLTIGLSTTLAVSSCIGEKLWIGKMADASVVPYDKKQWQVVWARDRAYRILDPKGEFLVKCEPFDNDYCYKLDKRFKPIYECQAMHLAEDEPQVAGNVGDINGVLIEAQHKICDRLGMGSRHSINFLEDEVRYLIKTRVVPVLGEEIKCYQGITPKNDEKK